MRRKKYKIWMIKNSIKYRNYYYIFFNFIKLNSLKLMFHLQTIFFNEHHIIKPKILNKIIIEKINISLYFQNKK